jgi:hypothetical protein
MDAKDPDHWWRVPFDRAITCACRTSPEHTDVCEVFTKVALINRMYGAHLGGDARDPEWNVAKEFVEGDADAVLALLRELPAFSAETLPIVVASQAGLVTLARRATGRNEESFCSKYASFHFPEVAPILDRYAEDFARRLTDGLCAADGQGRYEQHCRRVLYLADVLRSNAVANPSIKLMDHVLYGTRGA